jgi:hypothetical protein
MGICKMKINKLLWVQVIGNILSCKKMWNSKLIFTYTKIEHVTTYYSILWNAQYYKKNWFLLVIDCKIDVRTWVLYPWFETIWWSLVSYKITLRSSSLPSPTTFGMEWLWIKAEVLVFICCFALDFVQGSKPPNPKFFCSRSFPKLQMFNVPNSFLKP